MNQKIIIYQVFTRLFGNTNTCCKPNGTLQENGCGKFSDFTPKALHEIHTLGCTHIWYTGIIEHATQTDYTQYGIRKDNPYIVKGKAGSPYAIKDYYDVDPDLAEIPQNRMKEFEALVTRTHEAGLKMIIDFVPNHVARQYHSDKKPAGTKDLGEDDNTETHFSPNNNFYYIPRQEFCGQFPLGEGAEKYHEYPAKATGNDCFGAYPGINDWYETVKLNYGIDYLNNRQTHFDPIPNTWIKMRDILLFWASKQIDGFRCDMAEMVPVAFWGWVIPQIKDKFPHIDFIAEVYNPYEYRNYLFNGKFDYLYDKVGLYDLLREVVGGYRPASQITACWQSLDDIKGHMLNFLENHDEQRIASEYFAGDPQKAIPALVVSAMMNTNPFMLYFGQELGEAGMDCEGFSGKDGRTTIFDYWSINTVRNWVNEKKFNTARLSSQQKELRTLYKKILTCCNREKAIREGAFFDLMYVNLDNPQFNAYKQYCFFRKYQNEFILIAVNFDDRDTTVSIKIPQHAFDVAEIPETTEKLLFKELLTLEEKEAPLNPQNRFDTPIKAHRAVIWKTKIHTTDTKTKKKQESRRKYK